MCSALSRRCFRFHLSSRGPLMFGSIKSGVRGIMPRRLQIGSLMALAAAAAGSLSVHAQDFPNGPIHVMVGAAPGGLIDLFARTYAGKLQERSGQPVLVENNSVATGTIGAGLVAKSAPNGYTLIMGHPANM